MKTRTGGRPGTVLISMVILLTAMMMIALPTLNAMIRQNNTAAHKTKQRKAAFQLATAGLDRAVWKLKETAQNWQHILATGPLSGYNADVVYTDVGGGAGAYRIAISSTADADILDILATGRGPSGKEFLGVRAQVKRARILGPLYAYNLSYSSSIASVRLHWGPLYDYGRTILTSHHINQLYPRKFSAGGITASSGAYATRDNDAAAPNTDGSEYWSYQEMPLFPEPDFDFYRASAAALGNYKSGDYSPGALVDTVPTVRFVEGNLTLSGSDKFISGTTIVMGNCTMTGANTGGPGNYAAAPPAQAWSEYQRNTPTRRDKTGADAFGDTSAANEYPGDAGLAAAGPWTFGSSMAGVGGQRVSLRGVLYCGGNFTGASSPANTQVIHGALILGPSSQVQGHVEVFYDDSVRVVTAPKQIYTDDWKESPGRPF